MPRIELSPDGRCKVRNEFVIPFDQLPDGFARSIEDPPTMPATPRPAATIVLLRDDATDGMQLLLMRRNRNAGFVPGAWVFPGGRVDNEDGGAASVAGMDGLDAESAARRLDHHGEPPAIGFYLAALREAFEETGILVARRPDGSAPPTAAESREVDTVREAVMDDEISFAEAVARLGCRIAGNAIEYIAHWITPVPEPRRYDTRFFAARVAPDSTPIIDPREMTDALWVTPSEGLRRCEDGELPMVFPTIRTLEDLVEYASTDAALRGFGGAPVRTVLPTLVVTPTGVGLRIDDDTA